MTFGPRATDSGSRGMSKRRANVCLQSRRSRGGRVRAMAFFLDPRPNGMRFCWRKSSIEIPRKTDISTKNTPPPQADFETFYCNRFATNHTDEHADNRHRTSIRLVLNIVAILLCKIASVSIQVLRYLNISLFLYFRPLTDRINIRFTYFCKL